jgi:hypothetical protein
MPDLQSSANHPAPIDALSAGLCEPEDFALGFECADPSLQIERWLDEAERPLAVERIG